MTKEQFIQNVRQTWGNMAQENFGLPDDGEIAYLYDLAVKYNQDLREAIDWTVHIFHLTSK